MRRGVLALVLSTGLAAAAEPETEVTVAIDLAHPSHAISSRLYGLFLEDISQSVDGCLYRNSSGTAV